MATISQQILLWIAVLIQVLMQIMVILQWNEHEKQRMRQTAQFGGAYKEAAAVMGVSQERRQVMDELDKINNSPSHIFRFAFAVLSIAMSACFGLSNVWVQNEVQLNHCQLLIFALIQIQLWQEARMFIAKYDIAFLSADILVCALVSSSQLNAQEIVFAILASAIALFVAVTSLNVQILEVSMVDEQNDFERYDVGNRVMSSESRQAEDAFEEGKQLFIPQQANIPPNSTTSKKSFPQLPPYSNTFRISTHTLPIFSEPAYSGRLHSQRHLIRHNQHVPHQPGGTATTETQLHQQQTVQISEIIHVTDQKVSRLLSQHTGGGISSAVFHQSKQSSAFTLTNQNFQFNAENFNDQFRFYKGMVEQLDSAIFVIGGSNRVYEAMNSKAENLFKEYFALTNKSDDDFVSVFDNIIIKDYSKNCFDFLESLGLMKKEHNQGTFTHFSQEDTIQKKGTLAQYFSQSSHNGPTSAGQFQQQQQQQQHQSIVSYNSATQTSGNATNLQQITEMKRKSGLGLNINMMNQMAKGSGNGQNPLKLLNLKTQQTTYDEADANVNSLEINRTTKGSFQKNNQSNKQFVDMSLLKLIQKILEHKESETIQSEKTAIEVITFETDSRLNNILKFAQIKLLTYQLNKEQFLLLQFQNNREREETLQQKIHKATEHKMFKTFSHELGTYTNFILQILEGAMQDCSIPEKAKKNYLETMLNNAQLLSYIIQDIRDYNNHLNGDLRVKITSTHLQPLVIRTCKLFKQMAEIRNVKLEVVFGPDVPAKVYADKMKIQQILVHLIHNSLKFTVNGCRVCISISFNERTKIISFSVADNGLGMDDSERQRLQNLLDNLQLAEKVSQHSSGFGFGLTISNILAMRILSQGTITEDMTEADIEACTPGLHFTSKKGTGSEFRFFINMSDGESIVALSTSKELDIAKQTSKGRFNQGKLRDVEYFETEDEVLIQEKNDLSAAVVRKENNFLDVSQNLQVGKDTVIRTLSAKLSKKFENNLRFNLDKSRFFSSINEVPSPILTEGNQDESSIINNQNAHQTNKKELAKSPLNAYSNEPLQEIVVPIPKSKAEQAAADHDAQIAAGRAAGVTATTATNTTDTTTTAGTTSLQVKQDRDMQRKVTLSYMITTRNKRGVGEAAAALDSSTDEKNEAVVLPFFPTKANSSTQPTILIVDDEMMNIFGLKIILKSFGINSFVIRTANNGQEAVDLYKESLAASKTEPGIKLILMDINMPIMDGLDATQTILQLRIDHLKSLGLEPSSTQQHATNIVACTSYDDLETKLDCLKAGMISYLSKPFSKEGLQHILNKYYYGNISNKACNNNPNTSNNNFDTNNINAPNDSAPSGQL